MAKVSLVVLHFNKPELTKACLESVRQLETKNFKFEVIVVNNNPLEKIDFLKKEFPKFIFLKTSKNLGYAGGNNFGIKRAIKNGADFVLILNNDTFLDKDLIVELLKTAKADAKIGILAPKIYFAPGCEFHHQRYQKKDRGKVIWYAGGLVDEKIMVSSHRGVDEIDKGQFNSITATGFVTGCAMFVKREVFERIGFFDERYFLYYEDTDFSQRAKRAGYKIIFVPTAKVWHANAGSSEVGGKIHDYYMTRNRMLFGFKYGSLKIKIALARESLRILLKGSTWQKMGIRDFYLRRFGQAGFIP